MICLVLDYPSKVSVTLAGSGDKKYVVGYNVEVLINGRCSGKANWLRNVNVTVGANIIVNCHPHMYIIIAL